MKYILNFTNFLLHPRTLHFQFSFAECLRTMQQSPGQWNVGGNKISRYQVQRFKNCAQLSYIFKADNKNRYKNSILIMSFTATFSSFWKHGHFLCHHSNTVPREFNAKSLLSNNPQYINTFSQLLPKSTFMVKVLLFSVVSDSFQP